MMTWFRELKNSKKGNAYAWLIALVGLFVVGLAYVVMSKPFIEVSAYFEDDLMNDSVVETSSTYLKIQTVWKVWPVIVVLGIIIWAILQSIKPDPDSTLFQYQR